jgi:hypothetical protein
MTHFDRVMPGTVCRVIYRHVVENLETEVRRMLEFIGLPFEPTCREYYKNPRQFSSFSNEQVRSPIFREGLDRWKNYEPFLGAMKSALGPVLDAWPNVPEFEDQFAQLRIRLKQQERDEVNPAVVLLLRRQRRQPSTSCAGLQSGQLHADAGTAGGGQGERQG